MGAIIEALHRLQTIQRDLDILRGKEESIQRQIRACKRQLASNESEYDAHRQSITKCQHDINIIELDLKSAEDALSKHRQALNAAKSNKEYAAILTAINTEKADTAKLENRMLGLMSEKEQLEAGSKTFVDERQRINTRLKRIEADLAQYLDNVRPEYERLTKACDEAAADVPPSALATFKRVADKHEGEGLAEAVRVSTRRDEYVCSGCNMSLTLEVVNQLRSLDDLQLCNSCGRILFLKDPTT